MSRFRRHVVTNIYFPFLFNSFSGCLVRSGAYSRHRSGSPARSDHGPVSQAFGQHARRYACHQLSWHLHHSSYTSSSSHWSHQASSRYTRPLDEPSRKRQWYRAYHCNSGTPAESLKRQDSLRCQPGPTLEPSGTFWTSTGPLPVRTQSDSLLLQPLSKHFPPEAVHPHGLYIRLPPHVLFPFRSSISHLSGLTILSVCFLFVSRCDSEDTCQ